MQVGKAFTYVFEDNEWITKLLIGGGIILVGALFSWVLFVPLIAALAIVLGYALNVLRNVSQGDPNPLPKWENFGELFSRGIQAFIGQLIWGLPTLILFCCAFVPILLARAGNESGNNALSGLLVLIGVCFSCFAFITAIASSLFIYAPMTNFALNNQINTFWDFRGNWNFIRANVNNYLIAWLLGVMVAGVVAGAIGSITLGLLAAFAGFWSMLVGAHLFGQCARLDRMPNDSNMLPPASPMDPPSMMQDPYEPAPSA